MSELFIRPAEPADIDDIARIYTHEVLNGLATFETTPPTTNELAQRRQSLTDAGFPYIVACINDAVIGYAYAGPYRARAAYQNSVENSVYIDKNIRGKGVGAKLLEQLIAECEKGPWRQMIAVIGDSNNAGSVALHTKLGFRLVGTVEGVGFKLNQWVDTVLMQRAINGGSNTNPAEGQIGQAVKVQPEK